MLDSMVFLDKLIVALLLMRQKILKNLYVYYPNVSSPSLSPYTEPLKSNPRQLFMPEFNIILPWTRKYSKVSPKFRPHDYRSVNIFHFSACQRVYQFRHYGFTEPNDKHATFKIPISSYLSCLKSIYYFQTASQKIRTNLFLYTPWRPGGRRGLAPLILNLGARWRRVAKFNSRLLVSEEKNPLSIE